MFSIGECDLSLTLYLGGTCFRTLSDYNDYETCTINVETDCVLEVKSFDTEVNYDYLTVNGQGYSGSTGPDGVFVVAGQEIQFSSDGSFVGSGFNICGSPYSAHIPSSAPNDDSFETFKNIYYMIAAVFVLFICCLCIFFRMNRQSKKNNDRRVPNVEDRRNRRPQPHGGGKDLPKSGFLSQQSIEGVVDVVKIEPDARQTRRHQRDESDHLRPVFSFSDRVEVPIPSFESEPAVSGGQHLEELPESPDIELAPPAEEASQSVLALPADIAPPADLPPPYEVS